MSSGANMNGGPEGRTGTVGDVLRRNRRPLDGELRLDPAPAVTDRGSVAATGVRSGNAPAMRDCQGCIGERER